MSRRDPRRKRGGGRFARLPVVVLEHVAVRTLSHSAFRVLVLLVAQYHGGNNGALGITPSQASTSGVGSRHTLYKSLRELEARGLIEMTYPASRTPPRPTMWAITWEAVDATDYSTSTRRAARTFERWSPAA